MNQELEVQVQDVLDRMTKLVKLFRSFAQLGDIDVYTEIARRVFTREAERENPSVEELLDQS